MFGYLSFQSVCSGPLPAKENKYQYKIHHTTKEQLVLLA